MMQEWKFNIHDALKSIKGINVFPEDKWRNNVYENYADIKQITGSLHIDNSNIGNTHKGVRSFH